MKAIAALLQFFFSFFIKQEKQLVVISVCGDSSDNNLEMAIKGHAGLQYSQQNAPKLLISMGSRQDSLDSPASEWQLWTFCAHCNYSGGSWRGTNCKHIPREATMLNSVLGKGEISAAAMEVALWQLLGLLPDLLEGEAQRRASHPTWKLIQKCQALGQGQEAWVTCEPVEYLPGVRDPEVFPEPIELSVLFPLQQCVRRHFPYSLRTQPRKQQWWLVGSSSSKPQP